MGSSQCVELDWLMHVFLLEHNRTRCEKQKQNRNMVRSSCMNSIRSSGQAQTCGGTSFGGGNVFFKGKEDERVDKWTTVQRWQNIKGLGGEKVVLANLAI